MADQFTENDLQGFDIYLEEVDLDEIKPMHFDVSKFADLDLYCSENEDACSPVKKLIDRAVEDVNNADESEQMHFDVSKFADLELYCSENEDTALPIKHHTSTTQETSNVLDRVHPKSVVDYADEKTAYFMTHKLTGDEMLNKLSNNPWYNINYEDRKPMIIDNPADPSGKSKLWKFQGYGWGYDQMTILIPKKDIFDKVVDATFNYKGEIIKISIDDVGSAEFNKLLSASYELNAQAPQVALTQPRSPYIATDLSSIRFDYYCSPNTCQLESTALLKLNEDINGCFEVKAELRNGPCIHIPNIPVGHVRSKADDSFGQDYGCIEFKNELQKNRENESMKWGNYNHKIHSKNQSKQIKYKKNKTIDSEFQEHDNFDRWNQKVYIVGRQIKDQEVDYLPDHLVDHLDDYQLGFVHDHNAIIPACNLYGEGQLENVRLMQRSPILIDDYANNMKKTHGQRPNTTVISIPNPLEGTTSITIGQIISFSWSNDMWQQQYQAFWNRATVWGRRPIIAPFITVDYDIGRIIKLISVHNINMTPQQYHQICLQFCKQSVTLSPTQRNKLQLELCTSLIRICENHIDKNINLYFKDAPSTQSLICSIWNYCYNTMDWNHWELGVSTGFHIEGNEWIDIENGIWNKINYEQYINYNNEKKMDEHFQSMYKKKKRNKLRKLYQQNIQNNQNITSMFNKKKTNFNQRYITKYPYGKTGKNKKWFYRIDTELNVVTWSPFCNTIDIVIDQENNKYKMLLESPNFMSGYLFPYYLQYPGHSSAIIFNRFEDKTKNNMRSETVIRKYRQFVLPKISKHTLPEIDKYIREMHKDYFRDFQILLPLCRLGAAQEILNDPSMMGLYSHYKKKGRDALDDEKTIWKLLPKLIEKVKGFRINWSKESILESIETFVLLDSEMVLFSKCKEKSKRDKLNAILGGRIFSSNKSELKAILKYLNHGMKNIKSKEDASTFATDVELLFK